MTATATKTTPAQKAREEAGAKLEKLSGSQREIMRVILNAFKDFEDRKQHHYILNGMSTSHITVHAVLKDLAAIHIFWPKNQIVDHPGGGHTYQLSDDVGSKVQSTIRSDLDKLANKGLLDKVGNEDERRWKPVKALRGVTL